MMEFVRGWRRKFGVVTLGVACVGMAGWVRSITIKDTIELPIRGSTMNVCASSHSELHLIQSVIENRLIPEPQHPYGDRWRWRGRTALTHKKRIRFMGLDEFEWHWRQWGLSFGERRFAHSNGSRETVIIDTIWIIPYWFLVLPLTALSAFLLLTKPRHSTKPETLEPIPNAGANES